MEMTPSQATGVAKIHDLLANGRRLATLAGAAGTGKTAILSCLADDLPDVVVCTPTNKAAQVLISKGIFAQTFFKTFYILEEKKQRGIKPRFISCRRMLETIALARGGDWRDYEHMLPEGKRAWSDTIIIDEASMVTTRMAREMMTMCKSLVLVGDRHQLPPVGDADSPAGFFSTLKHDVELTEVLRQAEGSMILQAATEVRDGSAKAERALRFFNPEDSFESWVNRDAKMVCYTNKERQRINHVVRRILGFDKPYPMVGDVMISTANYSDDLINGTECRVLDFDWDGRSDTALIRLDTGMKTLACRMSMLAFAADQIQSQTSRLEERGFDSNGEHKTDEEFAELTFGYCLTAHKAQGSEWPAVAMFDQRGLIRKIAANDDRSGLTPEEMVRRWTYTVITRARKELAIAPTWWAAVPQQVFSME